MNEMPHPQIKFGTDGWRGVIADDFTFANVRTAAEAIAAYVHAREDPAKGLCIGYDTRFGSKAFARACAEVVSAAGIPVVLANKVGRLVDGIGQRGRVIIVDGDGGDGKTAETGADRICQIYVERLVAFGIAVIDDLNRDCL